MITRRYDLGWQMDEELTTIWRPLIWGERLGQKFNIFHSVFGANFMAAKKARDNFWFVENDNLMIIFLQKTFKKNFSHRLR
jgi:hypothetical protein